MLILAIVVPLELLGDFSQSVTHFLCPLKPIIVHFRFSCGVALAEANATFSQLLAAIAERSSARAAAAVLQFDVVALGATIVIVIHCAVPHMHRMECWNLRHWRGPFSDQ